MLQHEMPFKGNEDWDSFDNLDEFTQGYVHAIFWTECHGDNPELEHMTFADLAPESLAAIIEDCAEFQRDNAILIEMAKAARSGLVGEYSDEQAGTDYWLTRNGHGAGFWDRGLGECGNTLAGAAKLNGDRYVYAGDDKKLYISK